MKRQLLPMCLLLSLLGCGGDDETETSTPSTDTGRTDSMVMTGMDSGVTEDAMWVPDSVVIEPDMNSADAVALDMGPIIDGSLPDMMMPPPEPTQTTPSSCLFLRMRRIGKTSHTWQPPQPVLI